VTEVLLHYPLKTLYHIISYLCVLLNNSDTVSICCILCWWYGSPVQSNECSEHFRQLDQFLCTIRDAGIMFNLRNASGCHHKWNYVDR